MPLFLSRAASGQPAAFEPRVLTPSAGTVRGATLAGRQLITWGDRLLSFHLPEGAVTVLDAHPRFPFTGAGCLFDADGDGTPEFVLAEGGPEQALVWLQGPRRVRHVIDTGVETPDVLPAVIHGRRGVLIVQKFMQVRFYEPSAHPRERWPYREIYSIYTPSRQAGLLASDVDGDGRPDLFCGNYWIRCPERFDLPWRLFAINTWHETADSATLRLALGERGLFVSQGEMVAEARLALFEKPADPKQLWDVHRLDEGLGLRYPRALALVGDTLIVGENAGAGSRLLGFHAGAGGSFRPQQLAAGPGFRAALRIDDGSFVTAGGGRITLWQSADTRRPRESSPPAAEKKRR